LSKGAINVIGVSWIQERTIAKRIGICERTVRNHIRFFVEQGLISVHHIRYISKRFGKSISKKIKLFIFHPVEIQEEYEIVDVYHEQNDRVVYLTFEHEANHMTEEKAKAVGHDATGAVPSGIPSAFPNEKSLSIVEPQGLEGTLTDSNYKRAEEKLKEKQSITTYKQEIEESQLPQIVKMTLLKKLERCFSLRVCVSQLESLYQTYEKSINEWQFRAALLQGLDNFRVKEYQGRFCYTIVHTYRYFKHYLESLIEEREGEDKKEEKKKPVRVELVPDWLKDIRYDS
jgi:DNA-binding Lrp family transcriptional regulator